MPVKHQTLITIFLRSHTSLCTYLIEDKLFYLCVSLINLPLCVCFFPFFCRTEGDGKVAFDVVFGPAYKGISLGALVCAALYSDFGVNVGFAYDRKEAKDHGEGGKLVGASMEGKRVLVIDDVITAGTAIRASHTMLEKVGAKPVGVVIALDRAEKRSLDDPVSAVQAVARDLAIPVVSIVSLPQLQGFLKKSPDFSDEVLVSVSDYRTKYGV